MVLLVIFVSDYFAKNVGVSVWELWELRIEKTMTQDASLDSRLDAFNYALEDFVTSPILGSGAEYRNRRMMATENTVLFVGVAYGTVGLLLFSAVLWRVTKLVKKRWSRASSINRVIEPSLFFLYLLVLMTNDLFMFSMGTVVLSILVANDNGRVLGAKLSYIEQRGI